MTATSDPLAELVDRLRAADVAFPADLGVALVPTPGASHRSFPLVMRDGVRVAVDLHLPPVEPGASVPTCLRSTRYWRATVDSPPREHLGALEAARWTAHGFALVLVDARGTGASSGVWARGWDDAQRDDLVEIVDWVVAQPWSDGTVGGYGTSYEGTTALLLAATGHPAVRAVVPRFSLYDAYHHIAAPGGVPLDWFTEQWSAANWALDGHPERATCELALPLTGAVRPVDGDDGTDLAAARAEHAGNWDVWATNRAAQARMDPPPDGGMGTPLARIDELRRSRVPTWLWSGWYDGAYAAAQLAALADDALDVRVTIGPYAHGAAFPPLGDPLQPDLPNVPMADQLTDIAAFLRRHQHGTDVDPAPARLAYYRLGDGWHQSDTWPPSGVVPERFDLAGPRELDVDFAATTGTTTRWHTLMGGLPVRYPDRRSAAGLVRWTGPELPVPVGLTGTPVAHLEITATAPDFAVHVYLEAVAPDGTVLYLTEGQLRARHRRTAVAPYATYGPWSSCVEEDAQPFPVGEPEPLDLTLWPISVLLPAGWRVQVALAGADAGLFRRVPADGEVTLVVGDASWIELPQQR